MRIRYNLLHVLCKEKAERKSAATDERWMISIGKEGEGTLAEAAVVEHEATEEVALQRQR